MAEQISDYWKVPYGNDERRYLADVITKIYNELPQDMSFRLRLKSMLESLWYRAPELVPNTWHDIFGALTKYLVLYKDPDKNPQYIKNIQNIWSIALDKKTQFLYPDSSCVKEPTVNDSPENISAPPPVPSPAPPPVPPPAPPPVPPVPPPSCRGMQSYAPNHFKDTNKC